jgi:hypothetical protein
MVLKYSAFFIDSYRDLPLSIGGNIMKVLALNSSARTGGQSKTKLMLNHLVEGMREAGADVDGVNLREKNIKNKT